MRNADERWTGVGVEKMNSVILIGNLASDVETRRIGVSAMGYSMGDDFRQEFPWEV